MLAGQEVYLRVGLGLGVHDELQLLRGVNKICQLPGLVGEGLGLWPHTAEILRHIERAELGGLLGVTAACKQSNALLVINAHSWDRTWQMLTSPNLTWNAS